MLLRNKCAEKRSFPFPHSCRNGDSHQLPLSLREVGRKQGKVRWTFSPPNGRRRFFCAPAGTKGEGSRPSSPSLLPQGEGSLTPTPLPQAGEGSFVISEPSALARVLVYSGAYSKLLATRGQTGF